MAVFVTFMRPISATVVVTVKLSVTAKIEVVAMASIKKVVRIVFFMGFSLGALLLCKISVYVPFLKHSCIVGFIYTYVNSYNIFIIIN